jgi:hypothetical protein
LAEGVRVKRVQGELEMESDGCGRAAQDYRWDHWCGNLAEMLEVAYPEV